MNYEQQKKKSWNIKEQDFFEQITYKQAKAPGQAYSTDVKAQILALVKKYKQQLGEKK